MHFQFLFCSVIKSSILHRSQGDASAQSTSTHVWPVTQALARYKQPDRNVLAKQHKKRSSRFFFFCSLFYFRRVNNQGDTRFQSKMQEFDFS